MNCPHCKTQVLRFPVPEEYAAYAPKDAPGATICPTCLVMEPDEEPPSELPDFTTIGESFPAEPDAAVPMALGIGLLTSLALYRQQITELFDAVEEAGTDPMLVLDRLAASGSVDSQIDLQGRKQQLEQLRE
ncbi:DUF6276 family protein [Halorientalis salina]|uniref:DUF6276 family protein n=1 Tax=Halorientalis salina TaxID=2932266 RepID=UPI0010AD6BB7|nr:DUF6276 family protein [Halorientalis salina]